MPEIHCEQCGNVAQPEDSFCRQCGSSLGVKTGNQASSQPAVLERGGCLSFMLIGGLTGSTLTTIAYFLILVSFFRQPFFNVPIWMVLLLETVSSAEFIFAVAIWK